MKLTKDNRVLLFLIFIIVVVCLVIKWVSEDGLKLFGKVTGCGCGNKYNDKEKKILEDSKVQQSTEEGSGSFITNDSIDKVKDIFAPTKGLERGQDGKLLIDKEKIVEKKEVEFENKSENLVAEELENLIKNPSASIISQAAELSEKKREDKHSP